MEKDIPNFLYEMLENQYEESVINKIVKGYLAKRPVTLRVNTLKTNVEIVKKELKKNCLEYEEVEWSREALIINKAQERELRKLEIYKEGQIYLQSLSSMIPVICLEPKEGENILDMAAAPGGKTTQIATLSNNKALITACEKNKIRAERLKYNIEKQGANRVNVLMEDARRLNDYFSFDKILLDAPCSGSGIININDKNLSNVFTEELVKRVEKTQVDLLKKAINILKPGHEMIYSTCSILYNENEKNIQKILENKNIELVPIEKELFKGLPTLPVKLKGTISICPTDLYEGFFVAKLRKLR